MRPEQQQETDGQSPKRHLWHCGFFSGEIGSHWRVSRSGVGRIFWCMLEGDHPGCWDGMNCKGQEQKPEDPVRGCCNYPRERGRWPGPEK